MKKIRMNCTATLDETFADFLLSRRAEGLAEKTLESYSSQWKAVARHLDTGTDIAALQKADLDAMIVSIDYDILEVNYPYDDVDSFMELICDVLCSSAATMKIGNEQLSTDRVKTRYRQLEYGHIEYVIDTLKKTTNEIHNIRAYLLTALYNAPVTIGPYYSAAVRHDYG